MIDALIAIANHSRGQTLKLVNDLNDEQMVRQPAPGMNHPAWVLGHLLQVEYAFLALVKPGAAAPAYIDDNWKSVYGAKSVPKAEKQLYKPKAFYVDELNKARGQVVAALKGMTVEDFDKPHPDPARRERFPTVGHAVQLYGTWHEAYHGGQLSAWRRVQGLPAV